MLNSKVKQYFGLFLTVLMVGYFACMSLCLHTHIVNSRVVTHAHPYKSASHTHTGTEIAFFNALTFHAVEISFDAPISPIYIFLREILTFEVRDVKLQSIEYTLLRAPPFC